MRVEPDLGLLTLFERRRCGHPGCFKPSVRALDAAPVWWLRPSWVNEEGPPLKQSPKALLFILKEARSPLPPS